MSEDEAKRKAEHKPPSGDITKPWMRQFFECMPIRHGERLVRGAMLVPDRSEFLPPKERRR